MSCFENQQNSAIELLKKSITQQDVEGVLQKASNDLSIKVLEYNLEAYSSEVLGGLGSHWSLKITVQSKIQNERKILNFFLKHVPLICENWVGDFLREEHVFEEETTFFKEVFPILTDNYKGEKWSPTCYLVKSDTLVMEDLRLKGYKLRGNFFDDSKLLKSALGAIARFHSCTILAEARVNKPLNEYFPHSFREKAYTKSDFATRWHASSMNIAVAVAESLNRNSLNLRKSFQVIYDLVKPSSKHRNVICHGDLWTNNMMFDDVPECILIDFQTIRYAPLVLDILKLLYLNATREYRQKNEKDSIAYYYSILKKSVRDNDITNSIKIPTLDEVLAAYEDLRIFGAIVACLYFPIHLIDPDTVKEIPVKNSEGLMDFVRADRVEVTFACMKKNLWFRNKIEEAVIEFVELSEGEEYTISEQSKMPSFNFSKADIISMQDVELVAGKIICDLNVKILDYSLDDYSSEPLGYFGSHWQLKIVIQRSEKSKSENSEVLKLFVKSLPVDNKGHTDFVKNSGVFDEESFFFDEMLPQLTKNYNGQKLAPVCFLAKKNAIILEDLRDLGFKQHNSIEEFELMKSTLVTVARFHSCSILTEEQLSRSSRKKIRLDEYFPNAFIEKTYSRTVKTWGYLNAGFKVIAAVAERLGHDPKKIYNTCDQIFEMVQPSEKHCNVICHGDLWANNLMFNESNECLLLDFQFIRYMPLVLDLLHLFYKNSSKNFRKKYEVQLIELYHSILEETIHSNDTEVKIPSLEEILTAYEDLRLFGIILAGLHFPMALLDPKISAEKTKTSEGYEEFIFCDRTEVTLAYMEVNEFYKSTVEEVVHELADVTSSLC